MCRLDELQFTLVVLDWSDPLQAEATENEGNICDCSCLQCNVCRSHVHSRGQIGPSGGLHLVPGLHG